MRASTRLPAEPVADEVLVGRAVAASDRAFTIASLAAPEQPLVHVSPAFEAMTGYGAAECLGRNCRFLQGPGTDPAAVAELRSAIAERRSATVTLRNYRKDGTEFWNELALSPVAGDAGGVTHYVGVQADVTARVVAETERARAEAERAAALVREQAARAEAERANERLGFLLRASTRMTAIADGPGIAEHLARTALTLADLCVVDLVEESGALSRIVAGREGRSWEAARVALDAHYPPDPAADHAFARVLRTGVAEAWPPGEAGSPSPDEDEQRSRMAGLGIGSLRCVPLRARERLLGVVALFDALPGRRHGATDLAVAEDLGRRAALAVENSRLYARVQGVAEVLQRSLLPERLAPVPGLALAARYRPGAGVAVGGDWYDALPVEDGRAALTIGDVVGSGVPAAAVMGQLRSVVRAYALEGHGPAAVVERTSRWVAATGRGEMTTLVHALLDPATGRLRFVRAGHLPPLLVGPDASVAFLDADGSVPLGLADGAIAEGEAVLEPGAVLLLYTDGLVEARDRDLGAGLERLAAVARRFAPRGDLEALCDRVLAVGEGADDVSLLAVRREATP